MAREKETFRIFLGTYLEDKSAFDNFEAIKIEIEESCSIKMRWVNLDNYHLTWKFLDEITASRIERVVDQLNKSISEFKPMLVIFNKLVIWPNSNNPKQLVWLGYDEYNNSEENFKILDKNLHQIGFNKEKRSFKPHITMARFKSYQRPDKPIMFTHEEALPPVKFEITKISVIKSTLLPTGPVYEVIYDKHFNGINNTGLCHD